jgi:hemoglobin
MDTFFEAVGGQAYFDDLVTAFYTEVEQNTLLRRLYPADLSDSKRWMAMFLAQYFGGPATYSEAKGHPRLRMRHAHIKIGTAERDAWWNAMRTAVVASGITDPHLSAMLEYFTTSADWMINHDDQATTET